MKHLYNYNMTSDWILGSLSKHLISAGSTNQKWLWHFTVKGVKAEEKNAPHVDGVATSNAFSQFILTQESQKVQIFTAVWN